MDQLARFLLENSHLPGPRANLALGDEFALTASREEILAFADRPEEFLRFCGTQGVGRLLAESPAEAALLALLRQRSGDPLWRVREAVARALQLVGDRSRTQLQEIVAQWLRSDDPYVQRAALAAVCEPRLLTDAATQRVAREACQAATGWIRRLPAAARTRPDVRTLRLALGYCWSVAVAAEPQPGLSAFATLQSDPDPDVRWIVASNLKKARLRRLIGPA